MLAIFLSLSAWLIRLKQVRNTRHSQEQALAGLIAGCCRSPRVQHRQHAAAKRPIPTRKLVAHIAELSTFPPGREKSRGGCSYWLQESGRRPCQLALRARCDAATWAWALRSKTPRVLSARTAQVPPAVLSSHLFWSTCHYNYTTHNTEGHTTAPFTSTDLVQFARHKASRS
jgi:hypothetical protein